MKLLEYIKKTCKTCKKEKSLSEFSAHSKCKFGVRPECKECRTVRQLEYQKNNQQAYLAYQKQHYFDNNEQYKDYAIGHRDVRNKIRRERYANNTKYREEQKKLSIQYNAKNPLVKKRQRIKKAYGLSLEEFESMLKKQNNSCAICGFKDDGNKSFFPFVDHCHSSDIVRGLLCSKCNFGLGNFNDDIQLLKNAIKYLEDNE